MAYKFQLGEAVMSGSLVRSGSLTIKTDAGVTKFSVDKDNGNATSLGAITAGTSFIIGSADLNETDMEKLDGITNGTAAANKALVVDANKDIGTIRNLTIDGAFTDGNYTFDTSGNVTGLGSVACGAVTSTGQVLGTTLSGSTAVRAGGADLWGFSANGTSKFHSLAVGAYGISNSGALTASVASVSGLSSLQAVTASSTLGVEGASTLKGTVKLDGVADATIAVANDSLYFLDSDGLMKRDSFADVMAAAVASEPGLASSGGKLLFDPDSCAAVTPATGDALVFADSTDSNIPKKATFDAFAGVLASGTGIAASGVALSLDLNELSAAAVNVANDSIAIVDADDSNASKKESIADLATAMAGTGVTATNGVFSVDTTGGDSVSAAAIADGGTAAAGLNFFADLTDNAAINLPAAPAAGDVVIIKAKGIAASKAITINRQGSHVIDGATSLTLYSANGAVSLIYAAANDWRIV